MVTVFLKAKKIYTATATTMKSGTMLCCDKCNMWFHDECYGFDEDEVKNIDIILYIITAPVRTAIISQQSTRDHL